TQAARIVCDADGKPTGYLLEPAAIAVVENVLPVESAAGRARRLLDVLAAMASSGLTGGHVMDGEPETLALLDSVEARGELPMRLRLAPWCQPETDEDALREILDRQRGHGRRWTVDGVKFFLDGTIDGGTAWLETPDTHGDSTAPFWPDPADYSHAVRYFSDAGVPTATHATGDRAVRHALDTVEHIGQSPVRHSIEHIETLPPHQIPRFAALGVAASMQPTHCTDLTRADQTDNWSTRLAGERADRGWPCADLRAAGATLALGSDWPIAHYDPRRVIAAAQHRFGPDHHVKQSLTAYEAVEGYTSHVARAAGRAADSGMITAGHRADFTVLAANPLRVPAVELPDTPVAMTIVDGRLH
ncbi:MAG TPA: amidohydrolase family protein, partial [Pseudonocardiaceae bacterium]|nr:amidohydrolase family protein [Pseudonocardiaceae bacterium]